MEQPAITILNDNRIMTIATVRPDGWPQATMVGYANQGFRLYFLIHRTSQKFDNIGHNNRVAIIVAREPAKLWDVKAVYAGCSVHEVTDPAERSRAWQLLAKRHPNLTDLTPPEEVEVATMAADCKHVSVLDYSQGLGHTEALTVSDQLPDAQTASDAGSTDVERHAVKGAVSSSPRPKLAAHLAEACPYV